MKRSNRTIDNIHDVSKITKPGDNTKPLRVCWNAYMECGDENDEI